MVTQCHPPLRRLQYVFPHDMHRLTDEIPPPERAPRRLAGC